MTLATINNKSLLPGEVLSFWPEPLELTGCASADHDGLARITGCADQALQRLPAKQYRSSNEQEIADQILEHVRSVRDLYLRQHALQVYDRLTRERTVYLRLDELLTAVSLHFPALMPGSERLSADRGRIQAHKEGFDIDLGVIVRAFLRVRSSGIHLMDAMLRPTARALSLRSGFLADQKIDLGTVLLERRNSVGQLTLQNSENLNAENERLVDDLETAIDLVLMDEHIRVGSLRGGVMTHPKYAGKRVFCAGINLKSLRDGQIGLIEFLLTRELGLIGKLRSGLLLDPDKEGLERLRQKPWVAAVEAFAIGGGMQMLFAFDHVIADEDAFFSLPAATEGIVPGAANLRITRQLGGRLARRVILSGARIRASDPEAMLVCDEIVKGEDVAMALDRATEALASPAVVANRMMLNMAEERADDFREYMAEFSVVQARRALSADVLEKLDRNWSGTRGKQ